MTEATVKEKLLEALRDLTRKLNERVANVIDVGYFQNLEEKMQELQGKIDRKDPLSALDIREMLLIQRNIIVPALMKQEVNKLEAARAMLEAAEVK